MADKPISDVLKGDFKSVLQKTAQKFNFSPPILQRIKDVEFVEESFVTLEPKSEGAFGKVYTGFFKDNEKTQFIAKELKPVCGNVNIEDLLEEAAILSLITAMEHRNLVQFFQRHPGCPLFIYQSQPQFRLLFCMQLVDGDTLNDFNKELLDNSSKLSCIVQILDCLRLLHRHNLHHWDLHSGNIILKEDGTPILIDLGGLSTFCPPPVEGKPTYDDVEAFYHIIYELFDDHSNLPVIQPLLSGIDYPGERMNISQLCQYFGTTLNISSLKDSLMKLIDATSGATAIYRSRLENGMHFISFSDAFNPSTAGYDSYCKALPCFSGDDIDEKIKEYLANLSFANQTK